VLRAPRQIRTVSPTLRGSGSTNGVGQAELFTGLHIPLARGQASVEPPYACGLILNPPNSEPPWGIEPHLQRYKGRVSIQERKASLHECQARGLIFQPEGQLSGQNRTHRSGLERAEVLAPEFPLLEIAGPGPREADGGRTRIG